MIKLYIRFVVLIALVRLGISIHQTTGHAPCTISTMEQETRKILLISWKPISVFPDKALHPVSPSK